MMLHDRMCCDGCASVGEAWDVGDGGRDAPSRVGRWPARSGMKRGPYVTLVRYQSNIHLYSGRGPGTISFRQDVPSRRRVRALCRTVLDIDQPDSERHVTHHPSPTPATCISGSPLRTESADR